jgi:hypothetical protein
MAAVADPESLVDVGWNRGRHVGVDAEQSRRGLQAHLIDEPLPLAPARQQYVTLLIMPNRLLRLRWERSTPR